MHALLLILMRSVSRQHLCALVAAGVIYYILNWTIDRPKEFDMENTTEAKATVIDTPSCGLKAIARVEIVEQGKHFLKVGYQSDKVTWIPMSMLQNPTRRKRFLSDKFGIAVVGNEDLTGLTSNTEILPKFLGTSRLGWSANHEAFLYDGTVFYATSQSENQYEFIAPAGTLIATAAKAFSPKGDRQTQYDGYRELWKRSEEFRLVLSLTTLCPFMEVLEVPTIAFHLAGHLGYSDARYSPAQGICRRHFLQYLRDIPIHQRLDRRAFHLWFFRCQHRIVRKRHIYYQH